MVSGKEYDPEKTDIWSAGITLFYMLTGKLPFNDKNIKELYKKIIEGNIDFVIRNISSEAVDLLQGLLKTNPKQRLGFKQVFVHPWMQRYRPEGYPLFQKEELVGFINFR